MRVLTTIYTTKQDSRVSCLAQVRSTASAKGVQRINGSAFAGTYKLPQLALLYGFLATLFMKKMHRLNTEPTDWGLYLTKLRPTPSCM